jgi:hypothetical protein
MKIIASIEPRTQSPYGAGLLLLAASPVWPRADRRKILGRPRVRRSVAPSWSFWLTFSPFRDLPSRRRAKPRLFQRRGARTSGPALSRLDARLGEAAIGERELSSHSGLCEGLFRAHDLNLGQLLAAAGPRGGLPRACFVSRPGSGSIAPAECLHKCVSWRESAGSAPSSFRRGSRLPDHRSGGFGDVCGLLTKLLTVFGYSRNSTRQILSQKLDSAAILLTYRPQHNVLKS